MEHRAKDGEGGSPPALIVGLGNPGRRYAGTRHNVGFLVVDRIGEKLAAKAQRFDRSQLAEARRGERRVLLLKPGSYMNRSGEPTAETVARFRVPLAEVLVVHDDLDLPPGRIRVRPRGGAGGHRGVADIIRALGDPGFGRVRIGIGRPEAGSAEEYVLEKWSEEERAEMLEAVERASAACLHWMDHGVVSCMDRFNPDPAAEERRRVAERAGLETPDESEETTDGPERLEKSDAGGDDPPDPQLGKEL